MNESDNPGKDPDPNGIQPWIDPDLEARIVAAVVGEASDFELAELERLLEENAELAVFKRRIEAVHGLVGESFGEESTSTDEEWQMAPERREKLLQTLGLKSVEDAEPDLAESDMPNANKPTSVLRFPIRLWLGRLSAAAAVAAVVIVMLVVLPISQIKDSAPSFAAASRKLGAQTFAETESARDGLDSWRFRSAGQDAAVPAATVPFQLANTDSMGPADDSAGSYRESLRQLSEANRAGGVERLVEKAARPSLQAERSLFDRGEKAPESGRTESSDLAMVRRSAELALPGLSESEPAARPLAITGPAKPSSSAVSLSNEEEVRIAARFAEVTPELADGFDWIQAQGRPEESAPSRKSQISELEGRQKTTEGIQIAGNQSSDEQMVAQLGQQMLSDHLDPNFGREQIAKAAESKSESYAFVDESAPADGPKPSEPSSLFFRSAEPKLVSRGVVTRSGTRADVELEREFLDPSEHGLGVADSKEDVDELGSIAVASESDSDGAVPSYVISDPFSTAGKVAMNFDALDLEDKKRATGIDDILAGEAGADDGQVSRFGINLDVEPEVVELEGFVDLAEGVQDEGRERGRVSGRSQSLAAVVPENQAGDSKDSQWRSQAGAIAIAPGIAGGGSSLDGEGQQLFGEQPDTSRKYHLYARDASELAEPSSARQLGRTAMPVPSAQPSSSLAGGTTSLETSVRFEEAEEAVALGYADIDRAAAEGSLDFGAGFGTIDNFASDKDFVDDNEALGQLWGGLDAGAVAVPAQIDDNFALGEPQSESLAKGVLVTESEISEMDGEMAQGGRKAEAEGKVLSELAAMEESLDELKENVAVQSKRFRAKPSTGLKKLEAATEAHRGSQDSLALLRRLRDQVDDEIPGSTASLSREVFRDNTTRPMVAQKPISEEQRFALAREAADAAEAARANQDLGEAQVQLGKALQRLREDSTNPEVRGLREKLAPEYTELTRQKIDADLDAKAKQLEGMRLDMIAAAADPANLSANESEAELKAETEQLAAKLDEINSLRGDALIAKVIELSETSGGANPVKADIDFYYSFDGLERKGREVAAYRGGQAGDQLQRLEEVAEVRDRLAAYAEDYMEDAKLQLQVAKAKLLALKKRENPDATFETAPEFAPVTTTEELASENAFSTFSLNVSDVAFKLAQSALMKGEWPEAEKMRVEEFVNALDYGDPSPAPGEKVACRTEQCAHPFMQQRNLLRIAMQTAAVGRGGSQPLRLTILLDHSGSMQREDREASVRRAMEVLAGQLQSTDQVSLLGFARTPHLLEDRLSGSEGAKLIAAVDAAPSEGGTNLEEALRLAAEVAQRQFDDGAVNRIVLMTDGAANLGNADPEELAARVVELRQKGIAFDACGVGAKGLNDEVLEALTRKGDGRYYFLDAPEQADSGFASQLAGALRPAAKNVKVQVVFNPERVGAYRLIGYEKHRLKREDFRNDAVDAAEMAAEEAGVALYQFEPKADGMGDIGEVRVRFQDVASGQMIEHSWIIPYEKNVSPMNEAEPSIQLAGTAAMLGEYLRGGPEASNVDLDELSSLAPSLRSAFGDNVRVNQLIGMIRDAQMAK